MVAIMTLVGEIPKLSCQSVTVLDIPFLKRYDLQSKQIETFPYLF